MSDLLRDSCERALSHPFFAASAVWAQEAVRAYLAGKVSEADYDAVHRAVATILQTHAGRYNHAFLDSMWGPGNYTLRTVDLDDLDDPEIEAEVELALADPKLGFATCDEDSLTLLWFKDAPGWMEWTKATPLRPGIEIAPSTKIAKRCKVFTRLAFLHGWYSSINIGFIDDPTEFSDYSMSDAPEGIKPHAWAERFLDGANVVSRELIEDLAEQGIDSWYTVARKQAGIVYSANRELGTEFNPAIDPIETKGRIGRSIDHIKSVSIRVLGEFGQIKGEALVVPRDQIPGGYDFLAYRGNVKSETRVTFGNFVIAEPVHSPGEVFTDEQTMSWLGKFLYPAAVLMKSMKEEGEKLRKTLVNGDYPAFYSEVSEMEDDSISRFRRQALTWHADGLGLGQSIYLLERIIDGYHKQLMSKQRWPVPCAIYAHVATDSWLAAAGYLVDPESDKDTWPTGAVTKSTPLGQVWYHEASGRLVYNDYDFARLFDRHGGWDLDDAIKAHWRIVNGEKKIITVRCPNSYGEYEMMDPVESGWEPTWELQDGTVLHYLEVGDVEPPKYLEELDISYRRLTKPPKPDTSCGYTKEFVKGQIATALRSKGVFGRHANAQMVYDETMPTYRKEQLDSVEAIIDACTQELSDKALEEIDGDTNDILEEVKASGIPVDIELWLRRVGRQPRADMQYRQGLYTRRSQMHDTLCDLYRIQMIAEAQVAQKNIDPRVMELGKYRIKGARQIVDFFYELINRPGARDRQYYTDTNQALVDTLAQYPAQVQYDLVLAIARVCYTTPRTNNRYSDTVLFQIGDGKSDSVFDIYMRALRFYGITEDDWVKFVNCKCGKAVKITDPAVLQRIGGGEINANCDTCS